LDAKALRAGFKNDIADAETPEAVNEIIDVVVERANRERQDYHEFVQSTYSGFKNALYENSEPTP
jgi:hypothetical protein